MHRLQRLHDEEEGFSTAELLGNAALGVAAGWPQGNPVEHGLTLPDREE